MPPLFNFTLNCVICFDPFDEKEHYPVILPCGHTFVCHECASRLDNCHECRQSLFVEPKQATSIVDAVPPSTGANAMIPPVLSDDDDASELPKWYKPLPPRPSARERHGIYSLRKKKTKAPQEIVLEPIRLPLPKNLVLLEMIGVANAKIKQGQVDEDQCVDSTAKESINALTSECGTYLVKDTLQILKDRPPEMEGAIAGRSKTVVGVKYTDRDDMSRKSLGIRKTLSARKKKKPDSPNNKSKKSSPRRTKRHGRKGSTTHSFDGEDERDALSSNASIIPPEIGQLEPGDYIHVVAFDNGIAKLARRRGYVRARPEQLVKVAGPQDDVVAIEGQLCAMIKQRKVCLQDLVDMKKERTKLLLRLKLAMLEEETRKAEGGDLLLESLDEHYKTPDVPKELLRQSSALPEPSPHRSSPQCVSEIRVDLNNGPRGALPPPPPVAPSTPPPNMPSLEQEEDDDLGKQAAKIEAIRREYESASFFCCL